MASLAGGIFRTMEIRLFFFQGGTIRVVAGWPTASLFLYHIGCGIEPGKTSAQHGNWKINGYKLYRIGFGKEVSVVPLKLPYSSGCVGLRVYSMRKLTFRYIHVKHKRAEDYSLLPCKLKFSNQISDTRKTAIIEMYWKDWTSTLFAFCLAERSSIKESKYDVFWQGYQWMERGGTMLVLLWKIPWSPPKEHQYEVRTEFLLSNFRPCKPPKHLCRQNLSQPCGQKPVLRGSAQRKM